MLTPVFAIITDSFADAPSDQSLWGAQGLFDEDMHALFMSINQQAA